MLNPAPKIFKPAPPKFAKELAENGENDPEPAFLRQLQAGDRALDHRRKGELALWAACGVIAGGCIATFGYFVPLLWVIVMCVAVAVAVGARGLFLLWDAKMADVESRALVAEGEAKIRVLSDAEADERERERLRGLEMDAKAKAARTNGSANETSVS
jgi:hypothetical protein